MPEPMIYKVNDVPPPGPLLALSIQHMLIMFAVSAFPALLVREIGGDLELAAALVSLTMLIAGLGSILQGAPIKCVGSGYLCPNLCGPSYLGASLHAAWLGGIPLMRGMIVFAGLIEMAIGPMARKLTFMFPPIVVGLVVAMVGVSVVSIGTSNFFGVAYSGDSLRWQDLFIGAIALMIMAGANVWGGRWLRMFCLLIGTAVGWVLALLLLPESLGDLAAVGAKPFLALPSIPFDMWHITFSPALVVPFLIISVSGTLKSFGNFLAAQQISEPELAEPNMRPIANGILGDGLTTAAAGLIGALAVDTSSSNVGLAGATRACSRWICVLAGALFAALAFMPKVSAAIATIPRPVVGASLLFAGSFMITTGLKEMTAQEFDARAVFTVGISLMFGLSTGFMPDLYARFPESVQSFFTDPLATTSLFAIVLYQVFHFDVLYLRRA